MILKVKGQEKVEQSQAPCHRAPRTGQRMRDLENSTLRGKKRGSLVFADEDDNDS